MNILLTLEEKQEKIKLEKCKSFEVIINNKKYKSNYIL